VIRTCRSVEICESEQRQEKRMSSEIQTYRLPSQNSYNNQLMVGDDAMME
jgi:hypothetical protein